MAAAAHLTANVYGFVFGSPPYVASTEEKVFSNFSPFVSPLSMSFPTTGTIFHPVSPGVQVGNTSNYIYSVIEVQPTGLTNPNQSTKWASNQSVATLATAAG